VGRLQGTVWCHQDQTKNLVNEASTETAFAVSTKEHWEPSLTSSSMVAVAFAPDNRTCIAPELIGNASFNIEKGLCSC